MSQLRILKSTKTSLTFTAPAKLNLRLKIEGLRGDGYHLLSMLNLTCNLCDTITLEFRDAPLYTVTLLRDSFGKLPSLKERGESFVFEFEDPEKNLTTKAAKALFEALEIEGGVHIKISKSIPCGAGLGGGSSDAAAVMNAIARTFLIGNPSSAEKVHRALDAVAEKIGADVKYLLRGGVARVSGVGESIQKLRVPGIERLGLILILPNQGTSTKDVFSISRARAPKECLDQKLQNWAARFPLTDPISYSDLLDLIENDLTTPASQTLPLLDEIFDRLKGLDHALPSLTGSGSTVMLFSRTNWSPSRELYQSVSKLLLDLPLELRLVHYYAPHSSPETSSSINMISV